MVVEGRRGTSTWWRWAFWPAMVVLALNIETLTASFGGDRILTWLIRSGGPVIGWLASALASDAALYIALLLAGGGLYAWTEYFARRRDGRVIDPAKHLADMTHNLSLALSLGAKWKQRDEVIADISDTLVSCGLPSIPPGNLDDPAVSQRISIFAAAMSPIIRTGDFDLAEKVGSLILNQLGEKPEPQSPPDIEAETRQ